METNGNDPYLTAKIVSQYVAHHKLTSGEIPNLIMTVYQAIGHLGQTAEQEETRTPAVSIRRSVRQDCVVCLDCGFRAVTLRRHIRVQHGLTPDEYRQRWRLKNNHPLTAPAYSERRSTVAKALGFGRKPSTETAVVEVAVESPMPIAAEAETRSAPERKSRARRAAKPTDLANDRPSTTTHERGRTRSRTRVAAQP
jgi:predicted transcriptional regulator